MTQGKYLIIDRDGVINQDSDDYIKSPQEWHPIPGSLEAIALLHRAGWRIGVATNQSGLGRGLFERTTLNAIHHKMYHLVEEAGGHIDQLAYCPHTPEDQCPCRKPQPGLLLHIARQWQVPIDTLTFVGDSASDLAAARAAKATPVLVRSGKGETTLARLPDPQNLAVFDNLLAFAQQLLKEKST